MAREFLRPFTRVITIADGDAHSVDLTDSAGAILSCNYITVEAVSGGGTSFFQVIPSGTNVNMPPSEYVASTVYAAEVGIASGINGLASNNSGGSIVLGLAPFDAVSRVVISQGDTARTAYAVSYGNVALANQVQDSQASRGG
jgi:hypothetical protein